MKNKLLSAFVGGTFISGIILFGCQTAPKKEAVTTEGAWRWQTKMQLFEGEEKKSAAKGMWHIQGKSHLRLDIIGPLDLLMAQVYIGPKTTTLVNHSQKQVKETTSHEWVDIHGIKVKPIELISLIRQETPRASSSGPWSCRTTEGIWTCENKSLKASWLSPEQFAVEIPGRKLLVTIMNRTSTAEIAEDFFQPKYPSYYSKEP